MDNIKVERRCSVIVLKHALLHDQLIMLFFHGLVTLPMEFDHQKYSFGGSLYRAFRKLHW